MSELGRPFTGGSWCGKASGHQLYFSETSTVTASVKVIICLLILIHFPFLLQNPNKTCLFCGKLPIPMILMTLLRESVCNVEMSTENYPNWGQILTCADKLLSLSVCRLFKFFLPFCLLKKSNLLPFFPKPLHYRDKKIESHPFAITLGPNLHSFCRQVSSPCEFCPILRTKRNFLGIEHIFFMYRQKTRSNCHDITLHVTISSLLN